MLQHGIRHFRSVGLLDCISSFRIVGGRSLVGTAFFEHAVQGGDVVPRQAFTLVLPPDDVAQGFKFVYRWYFVV